MRGLQAPPKTDRPGRLVARFVTLIILAAAAGVAVYVAVTNQTADVAEDIRASGLELDDVTTVDGFRINVSVDDGGGEPVVILHDVDVTGGLNLDDLSAALPDGYHGVRIDLPGFGLSDRVTGVGQQHTVASMAERLVPVLEERFDNPVQIIGVGLGGEVGAELALSHPDLVGGLIMIDVNFWSQPRFPESLESLPWLGKAATYSWETGGRFALDHWAPHCAEGGWCPSGADLAARATIVEIEGTTDSLHSFRRTPQAALAPSNLDEVTVPMAYVWSTRGTVDEDTVDRITDEAPGITVTESDSFQAQLEDPGLVASAFAALVQR